jgi:hypothetical protein
MHRFLLALTAALVGCTVQAAPVVGGATSPDGKTVVAVDLPVDQRIKNIGSKVDGSGMCVFSSIEMAMHWQNLESWRGWRDWCAAKYPGGGWPGNVDSHIADYTTAKNLPPLLYLQYQGGDLAVARAALASGRAVSTTYNGHDPHYSGSVAHMTNLVAINDQWAAILDNNFIGDNQLVWMTPAEYQTRAGGSKMWQVVLLNPGPPPAPVNRIAPTPHYALADPLPKFGIDGTRLHRVRDVDPSYTGTRYEWRYYRSVPRHILLCRGEREVGAYNPATGLYQSYDDDSRTWGPESPPPFAAPDLPEAPDSDPVLCGAVTDYGCSLRSSDAERITLCGQPPWSCSPARSRSPAPYRRPIRHLRPGCRTIPGSCA